MFKKARYAYEIYKEGSYTKASRKLGISQPCLSQAISVIEKKLGSPLFDRSGVPLVPTPAGYEYIKAAKQICEIQDEFELRLGEINSLACGSLRIGCTSHIMLCVLPGVLERFHSKYPDIRISCVESDSGGLMKLLCDGGADFVIDSFSAEPQWAAMIPLFEERALLAVPECFEENEALASQYATPDSIFLKDADIASLPSVKPETFARRSFVIMDRENALGKFSRMAFTPAGTISASQQTTAYSLVKSGTACAFLTDTQFRFARQSSPVRLYNFAGGGYSNPRCCA